MERLRALPLTRRGWAVTGMIVGALILGLLFGARSLNAVVAPAAVAIVVALWRVSDIDFPTITRTWPSVGSVGERHTVDISLNTDLEHIGQITDEVSDGLGAEDNDRAVPLDDGLTYEIELTDRGRYEIGPTSVTVRDILGLAEINTSYSNEGEILVYPKVHPVTTPAMHHLADAADIQLVRERHEFDRLREYQPTDSLRDIHWKTSAKRPDTDFIVKEFVSVRERGSVILSGTAAKGGDDALAEAMASVASALIEAGVNVGVLTPHGRVPPVRNQEQFDQILTNLALMGPGEPWTQAEIHFTAEDDDLTAVEIAIDEISLTFGELLQGGDFGPEHQPEEQPFSTLEGVAD